jgi:hypothetical protein
MHRALSVVSPKQSIEAEAGERERERQKENGQWPHHKVTIKVVFSHSSRKEQCLDSQGEKNPQLFFEPKILYLKYVFGPQISTICFLTLTQKKYVPLKIAFTPDIVSISF